MYASWLAKRLLTVFPYFYVNLKQLAGHTKAVKMVHEPEDSTVEQSPYFSTDNLDEVKEEEGEKFH